MADEDGGPDAGRVQGSPVLQSKADTERQHDLRHERDVERAARVAGPLQAACVSERDGDEQARHAEVPQELPPSCTTTGSFSPKIASSCSGISRKSAPISAATHKPIRAVRCTACALRSGLPAPRFCPATAAAAPISPTDVHVMSENNSA